MATDLITLLLTQMSTTLTGAASMTTAMGSAHSATAPWLYHLWAKPDAPMPYLVHRFDLRANDGEWVTRSGTYQLDIYYSSNAATEALAIRDAIITLLDQQSWDISSGGTEYVTALRLWLQTEGFVPEDTEEVWHYTMQFNFRLIRKGEINNILNRT